MPEPLIASPPSQEAKIRAITKELKRGSFCSPDQEAGLEHWAKAILASLTSLEGGAPQ